MDVACHRDRGTDGESLLENNPVNQGSVPWLGDNQML